MKDDISDYHPASMASLEAAIPILSCAGSHEIIEHLDGNTL